MKTTATICRWVVIIWTAIFVIAACHHTYVLGSAMNAGTMTDAEGTSRWVFGRLGDLVLWAVVVVPAALIYFVTRDRH